MNFYEIIYNFSNISFGGCYRLIIDKETESMYYGNAVFLRNEKLISRFAINKKKIGKVNEIIENNTIFYRTYLFAETDEAAYQTALQSISSYIINKVNRMYVDSGLFSTTEKFTLRKGFKSILNNETKFATKCKICGAEVIFEDNGRFFASSDYIGTDICRNCMEEHCNSTNCLACNIGKYPNCKYLHLKES